VFYLEQIKFNDKARNIYSVFKNNLRHYSRLPNYLETKMKCQECRKNNMELLTSFDRIKCWILKRFFSEEVIDISQAKYTQGYGDGISRGREWAEKDIKKYVKEMYKIDL